MKEQAVHALYKTQSRTEKGEEAKPPTYSKVRAHISKPTKALLPQSFYEDWWFDKKLI